MYLKMQIYYYMSICCRKSEQITKHLLLGQVFCLVYGLKMVKNFLQQIGEGFSVFFRKSKQGIHLCRNVFGFFLQLQSFFSDGDHQIATVEAVPVSTDELLFF